MLSVYMARVTMTPSKTSAQMVRKRVESSRNGGLTEQLLIVGDRAIEAVCELDDTVDRPAAAVSSNQRNSRSHAYRI